MNQIKYVDMKILAFVLVVYLKNYAYIYSS
jgi:hypothetical protein